MKTFESLCSVIKEYGERIVEVAVLVVSQDVGRDVVKLC